MNPVNLSAGLALVLLTEIGRADPLDTWSSGSPLPQVGLSAIAYAQEEVVAVGWPGAILTPADGVNWVQRQSNIHAGTNSELYGIAYGNGGVVAVGKAKENTGTKGDVLSSPVILTSADGVNWLSQVLGAQPYTRINAVTYGNGQFVAVGAGYSPDLLEAGRAIILTSTDGTNWVQHQSAATTGLHAVTYASGQFVTAGSRGGILTSLDGVTWVKRPSATED